MESIEESSSSFTKTDYDEEGATQRIDTSTNNAKRELAKEETKAVGLLRCGVNFVLVVTTLTVSIICYFYTMNNEITKFQIRFHDQAWKVVDSFQSNSARRIATIDSFSKKITSYALSKDLEWPFVVVPDYEILGSSIAELADVLSIMFSPFVPEGKREQWEAFARENKKWMLESIAVQESNQKMLDARANAIANKTNSGSNRRQLQLLAVYDNILDRVSDQIYNGPSRGVDNSTGPWILNWQFAPYIPLPQLINYNMLGSNSHGGPLRSMLETETETVAPSISGEGGRRDIVNLFLEKRALHTGHNFSAEGPYTSLYYPIYDSFDVANRKFVGLLRSEVYWGTYFTDVLPDNEDGVIAVLHNTCNQSYTFEINGPRHEYLGEGDLHDINYDYLKIETGYGAFIQSDKLNATQGYCRYGINLYPSKKFEDQYVTNGPIIYTCILVLIFLFTSAVFVAYDWLVERRQKVVMNTAVKSTAIVSSLFPEQVRDRLYEEEQEKVDNKTNQLATFMADSSRTASRSSNLADPSSKPIAELFPNCTILFADIAGFTKWSASRKPEDVFCLLEGLYGEFDKTANKLSVYKIETIGDCYLAATGLPKPQENHAELCVKFASLCLRKMKKLIALEFHDKLGEDTASLSLRIGLHSGPVTAGVLRGEKCRFQLFGDTVNTASRMESTGKPGCIQVSQSTADLLIAAGKSSWVTPRQDVVEAKGKGILQTFWVDVGHEVPAASSATTSIISSMDYDGPVFPY